MKEPLRITLLLAGVVLAFVVLSAVKQAGRFFPLIFVPNGYDFFTSQKTEELPDPLITPGALRGASRLSEPSLLATDPTLGAGPQKVFVWSSLSCASCRDLTSAAISLAEKNPDWKLIWKDFPSPLYSDAQKVALAGRCAQEQNKFWPWAKAVLKIDGVIGEKSLDSAAVSAGLNMAEFKNCRILGRGQNLINASFAEGQALGVDGAPYFFTPKGAISGTVTETQAKKLLEAVNQENEVK